MGVIFDPILGSVRGDDTSLGALAALGVKPRYRIVGTLAQVLATPGSYGDDALVTNLGTGGTGVLVRYGSNGWRIPYDQSLYFDSTLTYAPALAGEAVVKQVLLPAGFSSLMSGLQVYAGFQKSGTAAAATACRMRIGTSGTITDAGVFSLATLAASNRSISHAKTLLFATSSSVTLAGSQNPASPDFATAPTGGVYPVAVAVNDTLTTDTWVSLSMSFAAVSDQPGAYLLRLVGIV